MGVSGTELGLSVVGASESTSKACSQSDITALPTERIVGLCNTVMDTAQESGAIQPFFFWFTLAGGEVCELRGSGAERRFPHAEGMTVTGNRE